MYNNIFCGIYIYRTTMFRTMSGLPVNPTNTILISLIIHSELGFMFTNLPITWGPHVLVDQRDYLGITYGNNRTKCHSNDVEWNYNNCAPELPLAMPF